MNQLHYGDDLEVLRDLGRKRGTAFGVFIRRQVIVGLAAALACIGLHAASSPEDLKTLTTLQEQVTSLMNQQKYAESDIQLHALRDAKIRILGPNDPSTIATRREWADALTSRGSAAEAETEYKKLLETIERHNEDTLKPDVLALKVEIAHTLTLQSKHEPAFKEYHDILDTIRFLQKRSWNNLIYSRKEIAHDLAVKGDYKNAAREGLGNFELQHRRENEMEDLIRITQHELDVLDSESRQECLRLIVMLEAAEQYQKALTYARMAERDTLAKDGADNRNYHHAKELRERLEVEVKDQVEKLKTRKIRRDPEADELLHWLSRHGIENPHPSTVSPTKTPQPSDSSQPSSNPSPSATYQPPLRFPGP